MSREAQGHHHQAPVAATGGPPPVRYIKAIQEILGEYTSMFPPSDEVEAHIEEIRRALEKITQLIPPDPPVESIQAEVEGEDCESRPTSPGPTGDVPRLDGKQPEYLKVEVLNAFLRHNYGTKKIPEYRKRGSLDGPEGRSWKNVHEWIRGVIIPLLPKHLKQYAYNPRIYKKITKGFHGDLGGIVSSQNNAELKRQQKKEQEEQQKKKQKKQQKNSKGTI